MRTGPKSYDFGVLKSITDPLNHASSFTHDALDRGSRLLLPRIMPVYETVA
ncbi:MAG: hypothetical protein ABSH34_37620 [Verrucomicrobiota bacterium]